MQSFIPFLEILIVCIMYLKYWEGKARKGVSGETEAYYCDDELITLMRMIVYLNVINILSAWMYMYTCITYECKQDDGLVIADAREGVICSSGGSSRHRIATCRQLASSKLPIYRSPQLQVYMLIML